MASDHRRGEGTPHAEKGMIAITLLGIKSPLVTGDLDAVS
jgi:hypothetical protein